MHISAQGGWKGSKVPQLGQSLKDKNTKDSVVFYSLFICIWAQVRQNREEEHMAALVLPVLEITASIMTRSGVLHNSKK